MFARLWEWITRAWARLKDVFFASMALGPSLRWIIVLSFALSALLCLPGQIQEIYRIAAEDYGWLIVKEGLGVSVIATMIWLGAFQLTSKFHQGLVPAGVNRWIPICLGALPIAGAIYGQHLAQPSQIAQAEVGSIFRIESQELRFQSHELTAILYGGVILLLVFLWCTWWASTKSRITKISRYANDTYFMEYRYFALTIFLIVLLTASFVWLPDTLAQTVGTIGVIALFTMSTVVVLIHFGLLTIEHEFPYIPALFGSLALVTALVGSDDHEIRSAKLGVTGDGRTTAEIAFRSWLTQPERAAEAGRLGKYPVFVVTAQGGGIYAAQNAARFLARMQDLCPGFRQHLFAISSVSGGSVGAAAFAAALHADNGPVETDPSSTQTCDKIAKFLNGVTQTQDLAVPGDTEQRVAEILKVDLVAPLAAGFLFTDFTQLFLPYPVPVLDRARFLEYTFENAGDAMLKRDKRTSGQSNLLTMDFQSHWAANTNMPALLLNTTDVGSGKRVVIAPFDIDKDHPKDADYCMLAQLKRDPNNGAVTSSSLHIPLSSAAFASARFPWLSPAATVFLQNDCITANPKARLVDGGYVENSGIETALALIDKLNLLKGADGVPDFHIYLLSLANDNFADHGPFDFGEAMEPVRALFSTQGARTSIAISRAALIDRLAASNAKPGAGEFKTFGKTNISGLFYSLPLGWTLSQETADIIALSSGRFWDCVPSPTFTQSRANQSPADCLQTKVFHLLNGDVAAALDAAVKFNKIESDYRKQLSDKPPVAKLDAQELLKCYEKDWIQERGHERYAYIRRKYAADAVTAKNNNQLPPPPVPHERTIYLSLFQTDQVNALLREWDRVEETDPHILAYILGSISYDSVDFAHTSENFWFNDTKKIPKTWRDRIARSNIVRTAAGKSAVDIRTLLRNPEALAKAAFGYDPPPGHAVNAFGNRPDTNDGWTYRLRGTYQLVGLEQYQDAQSQLQQLGQLLPDLDLVKTPEALWDPTISAQVAFAHFRLHRYAVTLANQPNQQTLFELLKANKDWKTVRSFQDDMGRDDNDLKAVVERSQMFEDCLTGKPKSRLDNLISDYKGEQ